MRIDLYRRSEAHHRFSYLAVPEGRPIPQEAINIDWQSVSRGTEMDDGADAWPAHGIQRPGEQIAQKGYAITSVTLMPG